MTEQLLGRVSRACSNEGDLVLDPFGGSGTTLAVAKILGRNWIGFELSAEYAGQIKKRLRGTRVGDPLDGAAEPLTSVSATKDGKRRGERTKRSRGPQTADLFSQLAHKRA